MKISAITGMFIREEAHLIMRLTLQKPLWISTESDASENKVYHEIAFPQELGWMALLSRVDHRKLVNASYQEYNPG